MILDEAIERYTNNAEYERTHGNLQGYLDFRQLAEWLRELKAYRERMPSYEAGYNDAKKEIALSGEYKRAYDRGYEQACKDKLDGDPVDIDKAVEHYEGTLEALKGIDLEVNE